MFLWREKKPLHSGLEKFQTQPSDSTQKFFFFSFFLWALSQFDPTDLCVASCIQKLVAAVAFEAQFVPVLPKRWHLLSCKSKTKDRRKWNQCKHSHQETFVQITVNNPALPVSSSINCACLHHRAPFNQSLQGGVTSPIASLSTIMIGLCCVVSGLDGDAVITPTEGLFSWRREQWGCLCTTQDTAMMS